MDANIIYTPSSAETCMFFLGQFAALSIAEGCCGLPLFSEALYDYVCQGQQYTGQHKEELPYYVTTVEAKVSLFSYIEIHFIFKSYN